MRTQRLLNRYATRLPSARTSLDELASVIHGLLQAGGGADPCLLSKSLSLLVNHLAARQATLVMGPPDLPETRWWYPELDGEAPPAAIASFCQWLHDHPERILAIRDMAVGPHRAGLPDVRSLPGAALGCALRHREEVKALLFVFFDQPQALGRAEVALLEAVAGFMAPVFQIEDLKQSLNRLEDALAITTAVMEDSSTSDTETSLPNRRYLDIWQRALLGAEHRPESLVVAEFHLTLRSRKDAARLQTAASGIRAGDLLVRMAPGRFQVIFRHTPRSLAHIQLLRLRTHLGRAPMGATLWVPGPEGRGIESCQPLLDEALAESRALPSPGLVWRLPDGMEEQPQPPRPPRKPSRGEPVPWQPIVLGAGATEASSTTLSPPGLAKAPARSSQLALPSKDET